MDQDRTDELIARADRRAVYANQVEHAKERFRSLNVLAWEGHLFELTPAFLSFVALIYTSRQAGRIKLAIGMLSSDVPQSPVMILDKNDEPVLIEDMDKFIEAIDECHTEAMNGYYDTYSKLQAARTAEELIAVT